MLFVTPLEAMKLAIFFDISNEPFMVTTQVGDSIVAKMVYINFRIMLHNRVNHVK